MKKRKTSITTNSITELCEEDAFSFQEIYERYVFKVYGFVNKYTKQTADSEDITQNIFIHLWKYRYKLNKETPIEAVLFKSAKQEISKWYKAQNKIISVSEDQIIEDIDEPYENDQDIINTKIKNIKILLSKIPERRRQIFILHKFDEFSYKEIATKMNMTPSAVANQISITLRYLRVRSVKNNELLWGLLIISNYVLETAITIVSG